VFTSTWLQCTRPTFDRLKVGLVHCSHVEVVKCLLTGIEGVAQPSCANTTLRHKHMAGPYDVR
jgi:hypothetical protein